MVNVPVYATKEDAEKFLGLHKGDWRHVHNDYYLMWSHKKDGRAIGGCVRDTDGDLKGWRGFLWDADGGQEYLQRAEPPRREKMFPSLGIAQRAVEKEWSDRREAKRAVHYQFVHGTVEGTVHTVHGSIPRRDFSIPNILRAHGFNPTEWRPSIPGDPEVLKRFRDGHYNPAAAAAAARNWIVENGFDKMVDIPMESMEQRVKAALVKKIEAAAEASLKMRWEKTTGILGNEEWLAFDSKGECRGVVTKEHASYEAWMVIHDSRDHISHDFQPKMNLLVEAKLLFELKWRELMEGKQHLPKKAITNPAARGNYWWWHNTLRGPGLTGSIVGCVLANAGGKTWSAFQDTGLGRRLMGVYSSQALAERTVEGLL